ncbi:MAG: superoxide dismutase family protein [Acidobacteriota bacterium]
MRNRQINLALSVLTLAMLFLAGCSQSASSSGSSRASAPTAAQSVPATSAVAVLTPGQNSKVSGNVTFTQSGNQVKIVAHVEGLTPGRHGFHIHDKGDCSSPDFSSAGAHFNPGGGKHGAPDAAEHHAGDFGNIEANAAGMAHAEFTSSAITLGDGTNSVVGRAVIVHAKADDLATQPTGDAGGRLACGVIQKK